VTQYTALFEQLSTVEFPCTNLSASNDAPHRIASVCSILDARKGPINIFMSWTFVSTNADCSKKCILMNLAELFSEKLRLPLIRVLVVGIPSNTPIWLDEFSGAFRVNVAQLL
jgi:hypothetical protein